MPEAELATQMLDFIEKSPSPYHCVAQAVAMLHAAGFKAHDEGAAPETLCPGEGGYIIRGGSLVAWRAGSAAVSEAGFIALGAHTDSPNLRIKPRPELQSEGYQQWGVEVYGGVLLTTWMDRDLGVAGRVMLRGDDGQPVMRLLKVDRPIARVPNLAIHLNRGVNKEGHKLNEQSHLPPLIGLGDDPVAFAAFVADELGVQPDDVISWDVGLFDLQAPTLGGLNREFVYSARLDNQASCFQCLRALLDAKPAKATQVIALFDHEEVGSRSHSGAMSAFLRDVLARIERDHEGRAPGGLERAIANSWLLSLDMAHAVHPNYADKHEKSHRPILGQGPVIKEHVEQRYATDAHTTALFRLACDAVGVKSQDFVIRTDLACGSTIGPISSGELGIKTIDIGNPMLSMHSIREQCATGDVADMIAVLTHVLNSR